MARKPLELLKFKDEASQNEVHQNKEDTPRKPLKILEFAQTEREKFEQLTPEEQAQAGAGIGPNVPADVPSIPRPGESETSAERVARLEREETFGEGMQEEILPTVGGIVGTILGIPGGPAGMVAGGVLGSMAGEGLQMTNETLRGDRDAPKAPDEVIGRLGEEAAWSLFGDALGFGLKHVGKTAVKAWNAGATKTRSALGKVEASIEKVPVVGDLLKIKGSKYKNMSKVFKDFASELSDRAINNLSKQEIGDLAENAIKGGKAVADTAAKQTLKQLDATTAIPGGMVMFNPIKPFAENRLSRFATGRTSEGMRVEVSPESRQLAASVLEVLSKAPDTMGFTGSFVLKNDFLDEAIKQAKDLGDDALANHFKAIQNRIGSVMGDTANRIGGETGSIYSTLMRDHSKLIEDANGTFLKEMTLRVPVNIGEELLPRLSPNKINDLKRRVITSEGGGEAWQQATAGYWKNIIDRVVDEDGVVQSKLLSDVMDNPQTKGQLKAIFGDKHVERLQNIRKMIELQARKPGDYLINSGALLGTIAQVIEPTTAAAIYGTVRYGGKVARGVGSSAEAAGRLKDASMDVLGRLLSNPASAELLKRALSMKGDDAGAARIMTQLTSAIAETAHNMQEATESEQTPKRKPLELLKFKDITPGDSETSGPTRDSVEDQDTKPSTPVSKDKMSKAQTKNPEDWIQKYRQLNPGTTREFAIKEGKRTGQLPKDYTSPPLGIRNNNPGNIRVSPTNWKGKVEDHKGPFERFKTPEDGIRAMTVNLRTYFNKYGLNTVSDIISRWAPVSDNNPTSRYIQTVARRMGVKPNEVLNLNDPKTMRKLVEAIIEVENGKQPYDDRTLSKGISGAMDRKAA